MRTTKQLSDEVLDAVSAANLMLTAFERAGVKYHQVTLISDSNNIGFSKILPPPQIRRKLPTWLTIHPRESLILSPRPPEDGDTQVVQLDDLPAATVDQIRSFVFCETETSPENYQVFIAISDGAHYDTKDIRRRLVAVTGADSGASGAFRIAGSFNAKEKHRRADGSYPRVRLVWVNHGHTVTVEELYTAGLLPPAPRAARRAVNPTVPSSASKRRSIGSRIVRRVPQYAKALADAPLKDDGAPDRSKADLFYARTCLFYWQPPLSREEVAELLLRHSDKAKEHSDPEWYVELTIDAAIEIYS